MNDAKLLIAKLNYIIAVVEDAHLTDEQIQFLDNKVSPLFKKTNAFVKVIKKLPLNSEETSTNK
jgi:hypothetical protein